MQQISLSLSHALLFFRLMGSFGSNAFVPVLLVLRFGVEICFSSVTSDIFISWCERHGKNYSSEVEKLYRFRIFEDNLTFVTQHNNMENSTYTLSLNDFADLTHHEFKCSRLGLSTSTIDRPQSFLTVPSAVRAVPPSIDWRKKGAVTPVKNQASCGACWAFSATGAIEGINQIVTGSLVSLTEQELVDCDRSYNSGCGGGLMDYAFQWVIENHGIDTEKDYPYQARERTCNKNRLKRHIVTIDSYIDVPPNNGQEILRIVASQPVSVSICGSDRAFQLYSKGIFNGPCSTALDHAVLIVGYGSENGVDYWILKNSWGTTWGMDGYMHMLRNSDSLQGVCGVNMLASYPTKSSPNPSPPSPGPTKCNFLIHCGAGETCCCTSRFLGICFKWKCCKLNSAVCCKDHRYCCPHDYPVCDTKRKQCLKGTGNSTLVKGLENRGSFGKFGSWSSFIESWNM